MTHTSPNNLDGHELAGLRDYLHEAGEPVDGALRSTLITGGRSNLTYELADDVRRWILRRPPRGGLTPSAHDMGREYLVTHALQTTDVPVARTVGLHEDVALLGAPFLVVEYVDGTTIRSARDLDRFSDDEVAASVESLVEVLAALHSVDHLAVGLEGFGRPDGYARRQLRRWSGQWAHVKTGDVVDADTLLEKLMDSAPPSGQTAIVHGDFRLDNTIVAADSPATIKALVDWELSTIGDPVGDVAMMCAYRHPALNDVLGVDAAWTSDRLPTVDNLAALYEKVSGTTLAHWDFFVALAFYKLAVIAQGIEFRLRAGAAASEGSEHAGDAVPRFLAAGLQVMAR
jgi:aminoglycoside phosphotransferase (APT) family kinase protein